MCIVKAFPTASKSRARTEDSARRLLIFNHFQKVRTAFWMLDSLNLYKLGRLITQDLHTETVGEINSTQITRLCNPSVWFWGFFGFLSRMHKLICKRGFKVHFRNSYQH